MLLCVMLVLRYMHIILLEIWLSIRNLFKLPSLLICWRTTTKLWHVSDKLQFVGTLFTSRLYCYSFAWLHSRVYTVHMPEIVQDTCRIIHIFHTILTLFYFLSGWSRFMNHQTNISNLKKIPAHRPSVKVTGQFLKKWKTQHQTVPRFHLTRHKM